MTVPQYYPSVFCAFGRRGDMIRMRPTGFAFPKGYCGTAIAVPYKGIFGLFLALKKFFEKFEKSA